MKSSVLLSKITFFVLCCQKDIALCCERLNYVCFSISFLYIYLGNPTVAECFQRLTCFSNSMHGFFGFVHVQVPKPCDERRVAVAEEDEKVDKSGCPCFSSRTTHHSTGCFEH